MSLLTLLLPALAPAAIDAVKSVAGGVARRIGGLSVDDEIKLEMAAVEKLKALAGLDTPSGTPSQWVIDLRASFRYIAAGVSILAGAYIAYTAAGNELMLAMAADLIGAPFAFIFGERMYFGLKGLKK